MNNIKQLFRYFFVGSFPFFYVESRFKLQFVNVICPIRFAGIEPLLNGRTILLQHPICQTKRRIQRSFPSQIREDIIQSFEQKLTEFISDLYLMRRQFLYVIQKQRVKLKVIRVPRLLQWNNSVLRQEKKRIGFDKKKERTTHCADSFLKLGRFLYSPYLFPVRKKKEWKKCIDFILIGFYCIFWEMVEILFLFF